MSRDLCLSDKTFATASVSSARVRGLADIRCRAGWKKIRYIHLPLSGPLAQSQERLKTNVNFLHIARDHREKFQSWLITGCRRPVRKRAICRRSLVARATSVAMWATTRKCVPVPSACATTASSQVSSMVGAESSQGYVQMRLTAVSGHESNNCPHPRTTESKSRFHTFHGSSSC